MAAAGVVCLQEFAQYDDWRIPKNIEIIEQAVREMSEKGNRNDPPFDRLHQLLRRPGLVPGGRRALEAVLSAASRPPGFQPDPRATIPRTTADGEPSGDVGGKAGMLYQTAVACFVLAIPNRYLPILQEGKIDSLRKQFEKESKILVPTLSFYPWLAIAGAAAAAVPVIVHLLNRRRFHVVQWAAMDFLREALTRSRRMMELRDLLLLLLRVACLLAFGMALARPYWNRFSQAAVDPNQPVHAVVLVDNSLSMSYQKPDGILLDDAKAKAKEWIEGLPSGSAISVLPTCGSPTGVNYEAYARREDALEALAAIQPVDCAARSGQVIDRALEACRRTTSMAGRRIFLVTDQQVADWSADAEREHLKQLPCPMQVEQVAADQIENVWVADVQLRDGVANAQCPAVFIATIGYQGAEPRKGIPVVLKVDGRQVASQTDRFAAGADARGHLPGVRISTGSFGPAAASTPATPRSRSPSPKEAVPFDRLPDDNRRAIVVPVADSLPVVFVDSLGAHEDAKKKVFGDTWWLRRWLAPQIRPAGSGSAAGRDPAPFDR